jgi:hypothetical protein
MLNLVKIRGGKIGAKGAVMACNNYTTSAGWGALIVAVLSADTGFGGDGFEGFTIFIATDAAYVDSRLRGKDILSFQKLASVFE